jgi:hypothetical protein
MIGEYKNKICRPVSRRLVTSQKSSVSCYNSIVHEQFILHRIPERLNAIDRMTKYCGLPWLEVMIHKVYAQMTEIRKHAEKKCQKNL